MTEVLARLQLLIKATSPKSVGISPSPFLVERMKNKYCAKSDLRNEADVEQSFVRRLLEDLGYSDAEIVPKNSLAELSIKGMRGKPQEHYRPDFGLRIKKNVRWTVEVKAPGEQLNHHVWQSRQYCVILNGTEAQERHVRYHLLTNGLETRLYDPYLNDPHLEMSFGDFVEGNKKFGQFIELLSRDKIILKNSDPAQKTLKLQKKSLSEVNAAFAWCHQYIYKMDDISQADAFTYFVMLIALKLLSDRAIRDKHPEILAQDIIEISVTDVAFSLDWIERNEEHVRNPINDTQFRSFISTMEKEIALGIRKRIFDKDEEIRLKSETIRGVVKKLEGIFLFGIDADLNGRLFETFLNATMRGKDLGQFFTPRSVVKLGVKLAQLKVGSLNGNGSRPTDQIIDACCGSGGFLIDALADMWAKVEVKTNLSNEEKKEFKKKIANNNIVGIDVANAPKLARIARLNMYLHGDGGSRIFHLNALDKEVADMDNDSPETSKERVELRKLFSTPNFDVVLTNPPFAKEYDRETEGGKRILGGYKIAKGNYPTQASVRSSLLFIERYHDILKVGGRMITIIDDGILGGPKYKWFRDQLREWFLIRAIVSLPGDAFQRSNARVKTSYLLLEKRNLDLTQDQPPAFMYPCQFVGIDDSKRQRARPGDTEARKTADTEIETVINEYNKFLNGENAKYSVNPKKIEDRLDVKNCLMSSGRKVDKWRKRGFRVLPLSEILDERIYQEDEIITKAQTDLIQVAVVRYNGVAEAGEEISPDEGSYDKLYPVYAGDILISNIAATYGSIAVVPPELEGSVVSNEYTILTVRDEFDPDTIQLILRSPEILSDILLSSSGANRSRVKWDEIKKIQIPYPDPNLVKQVQKDVTEAIRAKKQSIVSAESARDKIEENLLLTSDLANTILTAFKPPK